MHRDLDNTNGSVAMHALSSRLVRCRFRFRAGSLPAPAAGDAAGPAGGVISTPVTGPLSRSSTGIESKKRRKQVRVQRLAAAFRSDPGQVQGDASTQR